MWLRMSAAARAPHRELLGHLAAANQGSHLGCKSAHVVCGLLRQLRSLGLAVDVGLHHGCRLATGWARHLQSDTDAGQRPAHELHDGGRSRHLSVVFIRRIRRQRRRDLSIWRDRHGELRPSRQWRHHRSDRTLTGDTSATSASGQSQFFVAPRRGTSHAPKRVRACRSWAVRQ